MTILLAMLIGGFIGACVGAVGVTWLFLSGRWA